MNETDQNQEVVLDTRPKPFVFVLMPFEKGFTDVYQLGIKKACENAGAYAERLDEQLFDESMLQRIYNQIAKADVIVADMTGRNPNVFYEVGYAHALGKVVILLTKEKEDIPFDLKHYRHIVYENVTALLPALETAVRWAIEQASEKRQPKLPIAVYCEDRPLADGPTIVVAMPTKTGKRPEIQFPLTYGNVDELHVVKCRMALWTSEAFHSCRWEADPHADTVPTIYPVHHPKEAHVFTCPILMSLLPGEWRSDKVVLTAARLHDAGKSLEYVDETEGQTESVILRVSTESGSYTYPFALKIEPHPRP